MRFLFVKHAILFSPFKKSTQKHLINAQQKTKTSDGKLKIK